MFQDIQHPTDRPPCVFIVHDHMLRQLLNDIAEALTGWGVDVIRGPESSAGDKVNSLPEAYIAELKKADVAVFSSRTRCPRETLAACTERLRAVINPTIGVETVDVAAASEMGILVGNGATRENSSAMAEAAIMFMLNLFFNLRESEARLARGLARPTYDALYAQTISGKTIGILGLGNIGRAVAARLVPFGAKLLAHSSHARKSDVPEQLQLVGLDQLFRESDLVCICIAVTPQNRQVVNARTLALMKPSAYLVNIARGDAVDESALIDALQSRQIAGAALDAFAVEPLPMNSPLRSLSNVILTPHAVGYTRATVDSLKDAALENIRRALSGEPPRYCKNLEAKKRCPERYTINLLK